jgi:hypothetical protein
VWVKARIARSPVGTPRLKKALVFVGPNSFGLGVQYLVSKSRPLARESYRALPLRA